MPFARAARRRLIPVAIALFAALSGPVQIAQAFTGLPNLPVNACNNSSLPKSFGTNFPVPTDPMGFGFFDQSILGWEQNTYAPITYLSGSFFARGVPATFAAGRTGNAVSLNGSNQYVALPTGAVSALNDFTIAAWVNETSTSAWRRVFDFGTGTTTNMFLTPQSGSGTVRFAITTSGAGGEQRIDGTAALPTGGWHHVAVTLTGGAGILYVDGAEVGRNSAVTLRPSSLGSTTQNWIGRSEYSADPFLAGSVDDFRIYNRALSASEVRSLFQNP